MDLQEVINNKDNGIFLAEREAAALKYWQNSDQPEIAPVRRMELFALYVRGYSTEQIRKDNPAFSLGQIVHARVVDLWDVGVKQYRQRLRDSMIDQLVLAGMETARTAIDVLSASNHFLGQKARKYLETKMESDLPFPMEKVRDYQALVAIYQMMSGKAPNKPETSNLGNPDTVQAYVEEITDDSKVLALLAGKS